MDAACQKVKDAEVHKYLEDLESETLMKGKIFYGVQKISCKLPGKLSGATTQARGTLPGVPVSGTYNSQHVIRLSTDSQSHITRHRPRSPIILSSPTIQLLVRNCAHCPTRFSIPMSHVNKSSGAYLSFLCSLIVQRPTFASIVTHYVTNINSDRVRALIPVGLHLLYLFLCLASFHFTN
jgi:hypothetical protein